MATETVSTVRNAQTTDYASEGAAYILTGGKAGRLMNTSLTTPILGYPQTVLYTADFSTTFNGYSEVKETLIILPANPSNPDWTIYVCMKPSQYSLLGSTNNAFGAYVLGRADTQATGNPGLNETNAQYYPIALEEGYARSYKVTDFADSGVLTTSSSTIITNTLFPGANDLTGWMTQVILPGPLPLADKLTKAGLVGLTSGTPNQAVISDIRAQLAAVIVGGLEINYFDGVNLSNSVSTTSFTFKGVNKAGNTGVFYKRTPLTTVATPGSIDIPALSSASGTCVMYAPRDLAHYHDRELEITVRVYAPGSAAPVLPTIVVYTDFLYIDSTNTATIVSSPRVMIVTGQAGNYFGVDTYEVANTTFQQFGTPAFLLGIRVQSPTNFTAFGAGSYLDIQVGFSDFDISDRGRSLVALIGGGYSGTVSVMRNSSFILAPNIETLYNVRENLVQPAPPEIRDRVFEISRKMAGSSLGFTGTKEQMDNAVARIAQLVRTPEAHMVEDPTISATRYGASFFDKIGGFFGKASKFASRVASTTGMLSNVLGGHTFSATPLLKSARQRNREMHALYGNTTFVFAGVRPEEAGVPPRERPCCGARRQPRDAHYFTQSTWRAAESAQDCARRALLYLFLCGGKRVTATKLWRVAGSRSGSCTFQDMERECGEDLVKFKGQYYIHPHHLAGRVCITRDGRLAELNVHMLPRCEWVREQCDGHIACLDAPLHFYPHVLNQYLKYNTIEGLLEHCVTDTHSIYVMMCAGPTTLRLMPPVFIDRVVNCGSVPYNVIKEAAAEEYEGRNIYESVALFLSKPSNDVYGAYGDTSRKVGELADLVEALHIFSVNVPRPVDLLGVHRLRKLAAFMSEADPLADASERESTSFINWVEAMKIDGDEAHGGERYTATREHDTVSVRTAPIAPIPLVKCYRMSDLQLLPPALQKVVLAHMSEDRALEDLCHGTELEMLKKFLSHGGTTTSSASEVEDLLRLLGTDEGPYAEPADPPAGEEGEEGEDPEEEEEEVDPRRSGYLSVSVAPQVKVPAEREVPKPTAFDAHAENTRLNAEGSKYMISVQALGLEGIVDPYADQKFAGLLSRGAPTYPSKATFPVAKRNQGVPMTSPPSAILLVDLYVSDLPVQNPRGYNKMTLKTGTLYIDKVLAEDVNVLHQVGKIATVLLTFDNVTNKTLWVYIDFLSGKGKIEGNSFTLALAAAFLGMPCGPVLTGDYQHSNGTINGVGDLPYKISAVAATGRDILFPGSPDEASVIAMGVRYPIDGNVCRIPVTNTSDLLAYYMMQYPKKYFSSPSSYQTLTLGPNGNPEKMDWDVSAPIRVDAQQKHDSILAKNWREVVFKIFYPPEQRDHAFVSKLQAQRKAVLEGMTGARADVPSAGGARGRSLTRVATTVGLDKMAGLQPGSSKKRSQSAARHYVDVAPFYFFLHSPTGTSRGEVSSVSPFMSVRQSCLANKRTMVVKVGPDVMIYDRIFDRDGGTKHVGEGKTTWTSALDSAASLNRYLAQTDHYFEVKLDLADPNTWGAAAAAMTDIFSQRIATLITNVFVVARACFGFNDKYEKDDTTGLYKAKDTDPRIVSGLSGLNFASKQKYAGGPTPFDELGSRFVDMAREELKKAAKVVDGQPGPHNLIVLRFPLCDFREGEYYSKVAKPGAKRSPSSKPQRAFAPLESFFSSSSGSERFELRSMSTFEDIGSDAENEDIPQQQCPRTTLSNEEVLEQLFDGLDLRPLAPPMKKRLGRVGLACLIDRSNFPVYRREAVQMYAAMVDVLPPSVLQVTGLPYLQQTNSPSAAPLLKTHPP